MQSNKKNKNLTTKTFAKPKGLCTKTFHKNLTKKSFENPRGYALKIITKSVSICIKKRKFRF